MNVPNFASEVTACTSITYVDVSDLMPVVVISVTLGLLLFDALMYVGTRVVGFLWGVVRGLRRPL